MDGEHGAGSDDARPLVDSELATRLECRVVNGWMVEKREYNLGGITGSDWAGTRNGANTKPLGMTGNDEVRAVTLGE